MAENLINDGADVNVTNSNGETPLINAMRFGRLELAILLIAHGADFNATDNGGTSALALAAGDGYSNMTQLLVEKGANAKYPNAIKSAVLSNQTECAEILIRYGSDVNTTYQQNSHNFSLLLLAFQFKHFEVAKVLIENGTDVNFR